MVPQSLFLFFFSLSLRKYTYIRRPLASGRELDVVTHFPAETASGDGLFGLLQRGHGDGSKKDLFCLLSAVVRTTREGLYIASLAYLMDKV